MTSFHLQIVTPDGLFYDGQAESITLRTSTGEVGILANHTDYVATLGMGRAKVVMEGKERFAACIGGMVSVSGGKVTVVATTFEWAEDIDVKRAQRAAENAKALMADSNRTKQELKLAEARLKRALVRIGSAK